MVLLKTNITKKAKILTWPQIFFVYKKWAADRVDSSCIIDLSPDNLTFNINNNKSKTISVKSTKSIVYKH